MLPERAGYGRAARRRPTGRGGTVDRMEIRTLRASELELAWELEADSFHAAPEKREAMLRFSDPARILGAFEGERLVGLTSAFGFGQFFGGRSVPMGGLTAVAVAPDWRGRGVATRLCSDHLAIMHERGEALSSLFPGTTSLYRGLGWELAGSHAIRKLEPRALLALPRPEAGQARPMTDADQAAVREGYQRLAQPTNGCLDRSLPYWERRFASWSQQSRFVFENEAGGIDGYVVYRQHDGEYTHVGGEFGLAVSEIATWSRDAALGLWRLLGSWGSQADHLIYRGAVEDPTQLLAPEQYGTMLADFRWMTRVVDASAAVAARGFPAGLEVEVPLRLRDTIVTTNQADYVLSVQKGRGELTRCEGSRSGADSAQLGIAAFASLYTGWAGTADLARMGLLRGGSFDQRAALDAAFAGRTPWMLDEF